MSNMLYAVSILYKMKLPFLLVFNKTDMKSHEFAVEWMSDFESYLEAVQSGTDSNGNAQGDSYIASLMNSMALVLDEFYRCLKHTGVSSITAAGFDTLFEKFDACVEEYNEDYLPHLGDVKKE
jgi:GTPase SAR1 family protein